MKFGVVVPSRLAPRPGGLALRESGPELWLDGALASVREQSCFGNQWSTYVGVSPGALVPLHIFDYAHVVRASVPGQSAAVNAAADLAAKDCDVLLFLEDDDRWIPSKTGVQLPYLNEAPFVSCTQRVVSEQGEVLGANDYPTPSGWMMTSDLWKRVGGFAKNVRWMVDSDWLGRLNMARVRRIHLVPAGDCRSPNNLGFVSRMSEVTRCSEHRFLVDRTSNDSGGMATIEKDASAGKEADREAETLRKRHGYYPW